MLHLAAMTLAVTLAASTRPAATPTPAPTPTPQEDKTTTTVKQITDLLDKAGLEYKKDGEELELLYRYTDDRHQTVYVRPLSDLEGVGILEIYSRVMQIPDGSFNAALGRRLLEESGTQKLGYFGIEDVEGTAWLFAYHDLPTAGLTSDSLSVALGAVAELADEMEKEQRGASSDEY
jgi:hypothetical protein